MRYLGPFGLHMHGIGFEWYSGTLWHVQCLQCVKCLLDVLVSVILASVCDLLGLSKKVSQVSQLCTARGNSE